MVEVLNTIYSVGRLPELPQFAKRLETELGWKPVYWITQPELEDAVRDLFPDVYRHDFTLGNRAIGDPIARANLPTFTSVDVIPDAQDWVQLLRTLSRHVLGNAIGVDQQIAIVQERLDYCLRVVSALKIKRFVISSTPHALLDMCFYVAVRLLGGEARMQHLTGFRGMQVVLDEVNSQPFALAAVDQIDGDQLSFDGQVTLSNLLDREQDQTPWYVQNQNKRTQSQAKLYEAAAKLLDAGQIQPGKVCFDAPPLLTEIQAAPPKREKRSFFARKPIEIVEKVEQTRDPFARKFLPKHDEPMRRAFIHRPEGLAAPAITWREYYTYRDWALIQKLAWRRKYEELTQEFDIEASVKQPYAVFALHYQPERTTMPEGGWFADQELAIRIISEALPEGWKLLVKEHPSQFLWQTEGELGRDVGYYDRLAVIPGVTLVPLDVSSEALIENAKAVVTITGTIGWEAILRGVPVITMAHTWYEAPGTTLSAKNTSEMLQAFEKISNGWSPDEQEIRGHIARIEKIGTRCFINPSHAPLYSELTAGTNLEALVELFVKSEKLAKSL